MDYAGWHRQRITAVTDSRHCLTRRSIANHAHRSLNVSPIDKLVQAVRATRMIGRRLCCCGHTRASGAAVVDHCTQRASERARRATSHCSASFPACLTLTPSQGLATCRPSLQCLSAADLGFAAPPSPLARTRSLSLPLWLAHATAVSQRQASFS